jgi:uncharacterized membrane protein (UPF0127 family)
VKIAARVAVVVLAALAAAGCASPKRAPSPSADLVASLPPSNPPLETIEVAFDDGKVTAEVANSYDERTLGLMNRPKLGADAGMLFVWDGKVNGGFWMKNTLIPLSIAYMERDGTTLEVLKILDMEPCTTPTCPTYPPGLQYDAALEVNQGWFADHGVDEGDTARLSQSKG